MIYGKKYITADDIPEDILIVNDRLLMLESNKLDYRYIDLMEEYEK